MLLRPRFTHHSAGSSGCVSALGARVRATVRRIIRACEFVPAILTRAGSSRQTISSGSAVLPVLHVNCGLWKPRHLPCLTTAAIPVDVRVAQRDEA
jgi:hypothetical protein